MTYRLLALALALQGCWGLGGDEACAERCIERGRDDGYDDTYGLRCVCLTYDDDAGTTQSEEP